MTVTFVARADRPGCRPDRLAFRLGTDPAFRDAALVVVDAAGDPALPERLAPYPHLRWAVVRPAGEGTPLEAVRTADRWVFLPADAVPVAGLKDLLVGGEADAQTRRWGVATALRVNDLAADATAADWEGGRATGAGCYATDTRNWRRDPAEARTVCLAGTRVLVCGPEPAGRFLPRPGDRVEVVAEAPQ